jgi:hypothetical protein
MLASGSVASTAGASVSAWGRGADSLAAGAEPSSAIAALGSSPSQDKSVDFLHKYTTYIYYSRNIFTYKLDRTTVTVRACDNPPRKIPYYRLRPIHFGH